MKKLSVRTGSRTEFLDITSAIQQAVDESGVQNGLVTVFVPHTTAAVTINENADPSVKRDILFEINKVIPFDDNYHHLEGNSAAHIKSSLFGCSENIIIENGRLRLGTWQGIYFCEFDGPRHRQVWLQIIGQ
ncbi:YjbQ family protein [candidate division KSB1 bacterium]|nr:MAG: YjbQ family protein [candidate division KSB1 bacterium]